MSNNRLWLVMQDGRQSVFEPGENYSKTSLKKFVDDCLNVLEYSKAVFALTEVMTKKQINEFVFFCSSLAYDVFKKKYPKDEKIINALNETKRLIDGKPNMISDSIWIDSFEDVSLSRYEGVRVNFAANTIISALRTGIEGTLEWCRASCRSTAMSSALSYDETKQAYIKIIEYASSLVI